MRYYNYGKIRDFRFIHREENMDVANRTLLNFIFDCPLTR